MRSKQINPISDIETLTESPRFVSHQGLSLRSNFLWTLAGNMVYAGCQWGMLIVLAKLGSPEMVGQFALGLAITAPVIMFTNMALRGVQATDAKQNYLFGHYLGVRLLSTGLALLIIVGITLAGRYRQETALVILVIGLAKAFESISDIFYGLLQQQEQMDRIAISMILKGPLSLAALAMGVCLSGTVLWGVVGLTFSWALILLGYDVRSGTRIVGTISKKLSNCLVTQQDVWRSLRPRWEKRTLARLARLSWPLGVVMMLIALNTNIPRYFIEHYWGERELGIFSALAYFMVAGGTVVNALGQSASPRLAKYYALGHSLAYRFLLLKLVGLGALLGGAGVLAAGIAGREILTILYRPEYNQQVDVFLWLMVASGISYIASFLGYGLAATRAYHRFTIPYIFLSALAVGFSALFIPSHGLLGAAWTACAISVASCAVPIIIFTNLKRGIHGATSPSVG